MNTILKSEQPVTGVSTSRQWRIDRESPWLSATYRPDAESGGAGPVPAAMDCLRENTGFAECAPRLKWVGRRDGRPFRRMDFFEDEGKAETERLSQFLEAAEASLRNQQQRVAVQKLPDEPASVIDRLSEAGWEAREAEPGDSILIDLGQGPPARARVAGFCDREFLQVTWEFPLQDPSKTSPAPDDRDRIGEARSALLLRLSHEIRLAVPLLQPETGFALHASVPASNTEHLKDGISALAVAKEMSEAEFEALADPALSDAYLESFASSSRPNANPPN